MFLGWRWQVESIAFIYVGRKWCLGLAICPNAHVQMSIYTSLLWYCGNSTELEEGRSEALSVSDSPWLCDPRQGNLSSLGLSFIEVDGVRSVHFWGDFQL